MASEGKRPTPKFTSFRPQPSSTIANEDNVFSQASKVPVPKPRAVQKEHSKSAASSEGRDRHDKVSTHRLDSPISGRDLANQTFFLDEKGDPDNQRYGSLHKYSVPQYRRSGFGSVMGVPRWRKIDRDSQRSNAIELVSTQYDRRLRGSLQARPKNLAPELKIRPEAFSNVPLEIEDDFIAITEPRVKKRKRSLHDHDPSDSHSSDKTSDDAENTTEPVISTNDAPKDPDLDFSIAEPADLTQTPADSLIVDLNKRLRMIPSRGELWLELANATNETSSSVGAQGAAEVRMSILEEGLRKVKDPAGRETLLLAYVKDAEAAMDSERTLRTWEDLIKKNVQLMSLRLPFLQFVQTTFAVFRLNDFRDYAFEALLACKSLNLDPNNTSYEHTRQCFDLLLHTTACLRDTGFHELANAIWQINLEANFLRDKAANRNQNRLGHEAVSNVLEEFWEGESSRIGEVTEVGNLDFASREINPTKPHYNFYADMRKWSTVEQQASTIAEMSARTTDEDEQDDPFRVVLFSDIKPSICEATDEAGEKILINSFLAYFQLPSFVHGKHTNGDSINATLLTSSGATSLLDPDGSTGKPDLLYPIVNFFQLDEVSLFATSTSWFSPFGYTSQNANRYSFCRLALQRLIEAGVGSVALAEYALGWDLFAHPSVARKTARKALKRYPGSVRLYNAYALIEAKCGKDGAAEGVLRTVLDSNRNHTDSVLLQRTWLWLLIEAGSHDRALAKLLEFEHPQVTEHSTEQASTITVLKARKTISFEVDRLLSIGDREHAGLFMELGVLLEYLSSAAPLASALDSFKMFRSRFSPSIRNTRPDELLHQFRARLLYTHHKSGRDLAPIKPREILLDSIKEFPHNAIFFSLLELLDPWVGVNDRLHTILTSIRDPAHNGARDQRSVDQCITPHLYAARSEMRRYDEGKSTIHAVRHAFERAVGSDVGAHCPLLWKWYCAFECRAGDLKQARQKFYRAIRACPWVKDIYMMAFDELRSAMTVDDLKGVYELMEDKELRIRIPLDQTRLEELQPRKNL